MSKKTELNYCWWLIRSRLCGLLGIGLLLATVYLPFFKTCQYANLLFLVWWLILILGLLDGFGLIQKAKVKEAILKHEAQKKGGLTTKKPWEG